MGDVGKETEFRLVEQFNVLGMFLLVFERFSQLDAHLVGAYEIP